MDLFIKSYFDSHRQRQLLPAEISGKVVGTLFADAAKLAIWRDYKQGLRYTDRELGVQLVGALDDCLVDEEALVPLDFKTRGFAAKVDTNSYYQDQMDIYAFLLSQQGYSVRDFAYLLYYYPVHVGPNGTFQFAVEPQRIATDKTRIPHLLAAATATLSSPIPASDEHCAYCQWGHQMSSP